MCGNINYVELVAKLRVETFIRFHYNTWVTGNTSEILWSFWSFDIKITNDIVDTYVHKPVLHVERKKTFAQFQLKFNKLFRYTGSQKHIFLYKSTGFYILLIQFFFGICHKYRIIFMYKIFPWCNKTFYLYTCSYCII